MMSDVTAFDISGVFNVHHMHAVSQPKADIVAEE